MSEQTPHTGDSDLRAEINRELLHAILDTNADGVCLVDARGKIHLHNSTCESMFGYDEASLHSLSFPLLLVEDSRKLYATCLEDEARMRLMREDSAGVEVEGLRSDGQRIPLELLLNQLALPSRSGDLYVVVLRSLARRKELEAAAKAHQASLERAVELAQERARKQQEDLLELSTPTLEIWPRVILLPLIGTLDSRRTEDALEKALFRIAETRSSVMLIDITGVPIVDTMVANYLIQMAEAVRLMGATCILTGIRPAIAKTIVQLGVDLSTIRTRNSLAQGLEYAISLANAREKR